MTSADEMKLARDGQLSFGRAGVARSFRSLFPTIAHLPNGNVLTTDGASGAIEWGSAPTRETAE